MAMAAANAALCLAGGASRTADPAKYGPPCHGRKACLAAVDPAVAASQTLTPSLSWPCRSAVRLRLRRPPFAGYAPPRSSATSHGKEPPPISASATPLCQRGPSTASLVAQGCSVVFQLWAPSARSRKTSPRITRSAGSTPSRSARTSSSSRSWSCSVTGPTCTSSSDRS